jgi:hypothetical protein
MLRLLTLFPFLFAFACGGIDGVDLETSDVQIAVPLEITDITLVEATISAPDIPTPIVAELLITGDVATGIVAGIPAGIGRDFQVDAYVGMSLACSGSAVADIVIATRTLVHVSLDCFMAPPDTGEAEIIGAFNFPPEIKAVVATPASVPIGGMVDLLVDAYDPDGDPLTYLWTATDGAFGGDPTMPHTTWTAPAVAGNYTIAIEVTAGGHTVVIVIVIVVT